MSQAKYPCWKLGSFMVVMDGQVIMEISILSKPITMISSGTFKWKRAAAHIAAAANTSDIAKNAFGTVSKFNILQMDAYAVSKFTSGSLITIRGWREPVSKGCGYTGQPRAAIAFSSSHLFHNK